MISRPLILIDSAIVGGPGRGLFQLLKEFKAKPRQYLLCNFRYAKPKSTEFIEEALSNKFNLALLHQRFAFDPLPLLKFLKLAKRGKYNLLQSHGYKSHVAAAFAAALTRLPWVAFAHGWTREDKKVTLYHKLDKFLLRFATVVIAVSPELQDVFTQLRGKHKRTELILNAVDRDALTGVCGGNAIRKDNCITDDEFFIGCFGRLSAEKGQDVLLNAFAEVHTQIPNAKLLFLGDGIEEASLKSHCKELGIQTKVHFKSHDEHIRDYYEAIDLLVLPSRSEGLPNVVLEAMAFNVPVIATDVGAVREVISNGNNGWVVPPNDSKALAKCIVSAISDRAQLKAVGVAGSNSLFPKFCPKTRSKRIMDLYEEVCDRH